MFFRSQQGSAMILAIVITLVLGSLLATVLPYIIQSLSLGNATRKTIESQFIAEAGVKRVIATLAIANPDWSWLNSTETEKKWQNATNDTSITKRYNVKITNASGNIETPQKPPSGQTYIYTVRSEGEVEGITRIVVIDIEIKGDSGGSGNPYDPNAPNIPQFPYLALSGTTQYGGGDNHTLTISNDVVFKNSGTLGSHGSAWNNASLPSYVSLSLYVPETAWPAIPIERVTTAGAGMTTLNDPWGNNHTINATETLTSGTYFIDGDLYVNNGGSIQVPSGATRIHVKGTASVNGPITGNVTIYASTINLNQSANLAGNMQLFAVNDIHLNCPIRGYSLIMTDKGDINVNGGSILIKSYLLSGRNLTVDRGTKFAGSFAAKHTINLNGGIIWFDQTVIANWGKPYDTTQYN